MISSSRHICYRIQQRLYHKLAVRSWVLFSESVGWSLWVRIWWICSISVESRSFLSLIYRWSGIGRRSGCRKRRCIVCGMAGSSLFWPFVVHQGSSAGGQEDAAAAAEGGGAGVGIRWDCWTDRANIRWEAWRAARGSETSTWRPDIRSVWSRWSVGSK